MELDDKLKRDIQMIQMRNYMDPKRFVAIDWLLLPCL